jgi:inosine-uridine nucleoside N-ribohydrolase
MANYADRRSSWCAAQKFKWARSALVAFACVAGCAVPEPPDGGDCVLNAPVTCGKLSVTEIGSRTRVVFDTDAQFRGDPTTSRPREQGAVGDQYALMYLLLRSDMLQIVAATTANVNGGSVDAQVDEVRRVATLCGEPDLPIKRGAEGVYADLKDQVEDADFDGVEAVSSIVNAARRATPQDRLAILLGTKATNVALALTKDPSIAPNIVVYWTATNQPGAGYGDGRRGGSGMYNIAKDPDAANYLLAAPVELHLMQLWEGERPDVTQPRFTVATPGLSIKGAADLPCTGPRVAPVTFPDDRQYWTAGSYANAIYTTYLGQGWRAMDEAGLAILLAHPELAGDIAIPAPSYDGTQMIYPETGDRLVHVYDQIQAARVEHEFLDTLANPFVSCEWSR